MSPLIEEKMDELKSLCERYRVLRLEIFGSAATGDRFDEQKSDLDFLVEFKPLEDDQYADTYFGLLFALENLFEKSVDLVMTEAIRNPYFQEAVDLSRMVLFAALK